MLWGCLYAGRIYWRKVMTAVVVYQVCSIYKEAWMPAPKKEYVDSTWYYKHNADARAKLCNDILSMALASKREQTGRDEWFEVRPLACKDELEDSIPSAA
jgi:predicted oxidoreductase